MSRKRITCIASAARMLGVALPFLLSACFATPDFSKVPCGKTVPQCPSGYQCNTSTNKCSPVVDAPSVGDTTGGSAEVASEVRASMDVARSEDAAALDQSSGETSLRHDTSEGGDVVNQPDLLQPDLPNQADLTSDLATPPDLPVDVVNVADGGTDTPHDVPVVPDTPLVSDARPDAAPDTNVGPGLSPNGTACSAGSTCSSNNCSDGVCCDLLCTGACQSCALTNKVGTCSFVTGAPALGHPTCAGTGPCAGSCKGNASTCSYPGASTSCGSASCAANLQTAATSCAGDGTCTQAATQGCGIYGCNTAGTACATSCPLAQTGCPTACVNLQTSTTNCGACGNDCQGGACSAGACQPIVVAGNLETTPTVFSVDSQYVYFSTFPNPPSSKVYVVAKTASNGSPTPISSDGGPGAGLGVIGTKVFLMGMQGTNRSCDVSACDSTAASLPGFRGLALFKSPSPTNFAEQTFDATNMVITWYTTSNVVFATYSETIVNSATYSSAAAAGNSVYWIRNNYNAGGTLTSIGLYASPSNATYSQLAGGLTQTMTIIDANSQSILLADSNASNSLYRVPLPSGLGTAQPQLLNGAYGVGTEDANYVYWNDLGTIYKCKPANCANTSSYYHIPQQSATGPLYQDDSALYWGNTSPNQVVKLPK
jgi:hypothetical protein